MITSVGEHSQPGSRLLSTGSRRNITRYVRRNIYGIVGCVIVGIVVLCALFSPEISPHDPNQQDLVNRLQAPAWVTGDDTYLLGTDSLGRDILSRIIYGARISLLVGIASVVMSGAIGITLGLASGYFRGGIDALIMRIGDIQLAIPTLIFAMALVAVLGASLMNTILVMGITGWVVYARVVRSQTLSIRESEYIAAARSIGSGDLRMIMRHILPNVVSSIIIVSSLRVAAMIPMEATLSYLGLGVQPPTPTWGGMISEGRALIFDAWWVATFPGLAIVFTVLGINMIGDWLRDILDPQFRSA